MDNFRWGSHGQIGPWMRQCRPTAARQCSLSVVSPIGEVLPDSDGVETFVLKPSRDRDIMISRVDRINLMIYNDAIIINLN